MIVLESARPGSTSTLSSFASSPSEAARAIVDYYRSYAEINLRLRYYANFARGAHPSTAIYTSVFGDTAAITLSMSANISKKT